VLPAEHSVNWSENGRATGVVACLSPPHVTMALSCPKMRALPGRQPAMEEIYERAETN
jgi:hypothetical protein